MAFVLGFLRRVLGLRRPSDCGMQEQGVFPPVYPLLLHAFFVFGECLVMRKGLLWQCKMLEKQKEAVE